MTTTFSDSFYWVWLQQIVGFGSAKLPDLLEHFSHAKNIYENKNKLSSYGIRFSPAELSRIQKVKDDDVLKILSECENRNIKLLTPNQKDYPERVGNIHNPPVVLYYRGTLPDIDNEPIIAIVGTRKPSEFGKKAAYSLAAKLALSGMPIVSGGAMGIDSFAHVGTLKAGGTALCVLGCGIDNAYLKKSEPLRNKIEESGCVISEYPPLTSATKYSFPVRNRIISALSVGVAVIEASHKSGAMITAGHAIDQGRDVFAIPGNIDLDCYSGTNVLIRDGARPLLSALDIIDEYIGHFGEKMNRAGTFADDTKAKLVAGLKAEEKLQGKPAKTAPKKVRVTDPEIFEKPNLTEKDLSPAALSVYNTYTRWVESSDDLSVRCNLGAEDFLTALTELELLGYIKAVPVGRYELLVSGR